MIQYTQKMAMQHLNTLLLSLLIACVIGLIVAIVYKETSAIVILSVGVISSGWGLYVKYKKSAQIYKQRSETHNRPSMFTMGTPEKTF